MATMPSQFNRYFRMFPYDLIESLNAKTSLEQHKGINGIHTAGHVFIKSGIIRSVTTASGP